MTGKDEGGTVLPCLSNLEQRLKEIEKTVGTKSKDADQSDLERKVTDVISDAQKRLKGAEAKSPVLGKVFKQLESLDDYLSAEFFQRLSVNKEAKADLIICGEQKIKNSIEKLEEIDLSKDVLKKTNLQDTPEWNKKLQPLIQLQIQQNDSSEELTARFNNLLSAYNNIISSLSKQFVQWETVLTQCEIAVDTARAANDN